MRQRHCMLVLTVRANWAVASQNHVCREKVERERKALLARQQAEEAERLTEETRRSQVPIYLAGLDQESTFDCFARSCQFTVGSTRTVMAMCKHDPRISRRGVSTPGWPVSAHTVCCDHRH